MVSVGTTLPFYLNLQLYLAMAPSAQPTVVSQLQELPELLKKQSLNGTVTEIPDQNYEVKNEVNNPRRSATFELEEHPINVVPTLRVSISLQHAPCQF